MADTLPVLWEERATPRDPVGVIARDEAARTLARRTLERDDTYLSRLRAAGGTAECLLLLLGATEDLPWADGVIYLGTDGDAPSLLLPTMLTPSAPLPLVERLILQRAGDLPIPVVYLPDTGLLLSATIARPVSRRVLSVWLSAWEAASG